MHEKPNTCELGILSRWCCVKLLSQSAYIANSHSVSKLCVTKHEDKLGGNVHLIVQLRAVYQCQALQLHNSSQKLQTGLGFAQGLAEIDMVLLFSCLNREIINTAPRHHFMLAL